MINKFFANRERLTIISMKEAAGWPLFAALPPREARAPTHTNAKEDVPHCRFFADG
jgi:hypothetical protein